jgi:hypothetical protein
VTSRNVIVGLASAFSLLVGVGVGHWLIDGRPADRPALDATPAGDPAATEEMLAVLKELRSSLEALTRAFEQRRVSETSVPVASQREAAESAPRQELDSDALASALRALAVAIGELPTRPGAERVAAPEELKTPAWVDRESAFAATGLRQAAESGEVDGGPAEQAFRVRHLFKTYQDVLSMYGAPDSIQVHNSLREWEYENSSARGSETFSFWFDEGTVIEAGYNCSWK